jgi:hypothetical protein
MDVWLVVLRYSFSLLAFAYQPLQAQLHDSFKYRRCTQRLFLYGDAKHCVFIAGLDLQSKSFIQGFIILNHMRPRQQ